MNIVKPFGYYLISVFNLIAFVISYNKLTCKNNRINTKNIIVILLGSLVFTISFYYSNSINKLLINLLVGFISVFMINRENLSKTLANIIIVYLIFFIIEIITSSVVMIIGIVDLDIFDTNILLKAIITIIDLTLLYFICSIKLIINYAYKISNKVKNNTLLIVLIAISLIVFIISDIRYYETFNDTIYISNIIILICIIIMLLFIIKTYIDNTREKQKTEAILYFMRKYERIIDEDRINKHELLNDLLFLKSISNKNSKDYNESLDNLIDKFTNKGIKIKNVYNLPSGLKGIFYYKLYGLDDKGFDININVSKKVLVSLKKIKYDDFITLYKIIGIVLDNAIEASNKTKNKYILIDIYENENIVIEINNSYKGNIDLNMINEKYYSTKGKNRGIGLYIINNIIRNNNNISLKQSISNNIFNTIITIKKWVLN